MGIKVSVALLFLCGSGYATDVVGGTHVVLPTFSTKEGATITATAVKGWSMKSAQIDNLASWTEASISGNNASTAYISTSTAKFAVTLSGELIPPEGSGSGGPTDFSIKANFEGELYIDASATIIAEGGASATLSAKVEDEEVKVNWSIKKSTQGNSWSGADIEEMGSITVGNGGKWNPPADTYTITATDPSGDMKPASITFKVIKLESLSVSGATQEKERVMNRADTNNWVTIKGNGDVTITAVIVPAVLESELPDKLITWTGGNAVKGHPLQRKVSKKTAAKTSVSATCGSSSESLDLWVIWASVVIQVSGQIPAHLPPFQYNNRQCGVYVLSNPVRGGGNMLAKVTLSPAGIGGIVSGWDIKRLKQECLVVDTVDKIRDIQWQDDDKSNDDEILTPQNDMIYAVDSPNLGLFSDYPDANVFTRVINFKEWVEWNGVKCSDEAFWHYRGSFFYLSQKILGHELGIGHVQFPTAP